MAVFTVHAKGDPRRPEVAEGAVFVKEGFALFAFLLQPFYLVAQRLWLGLGLYFAGLLVINGAVMLLNGDALVSTLSGFAFSALFGLEAPALRQRWLRRKGFVHVGSVVAKTAEEAETTYFRGLASAPTPVPTPTPVEPPPAPGPWSTPVGVAPQTLFPMGGPTR